MNVSVGDMAVIIESECGNDGRIVTVERLLEPVPAIWLTRSEGSPLRGWVSDDPDDRRMATDMHLEVLDSQLRRVSGLPDSDTIDTTLPIDAENLARQP
jgi:hypothetical protein